MEKSRSFVVGVGLLVLLFMGWIAWITFKSPINPETAEIQLPQGEMTQLRHDLSEYIVEKLKKERAGTELIDISLDMPLDDNGKLRVGYLISFKDGKVGAESSIHAIAVLERDGSLWKVTKVLPQKETITYDQNALVKADSKPSKDTSEGSQNN